MAAARRYPVWYCILDADAVLISPPPFKNSPHGLSPRLGSGEVEIYVCQTGQNPLEPTSLNVPDRSGILFDLGTALLDEQFSLL